MFYISITYTDYLAYCIFIYYTNYQSISVQSTIQTLSIYRVYRIEREIINLPPTLCRYFGKYMIYNIQYEDIIFGYIYMLGL